MFDFDAVILAAGLSSRMRDFKPLVSLAGRSPLARCVELFNRTGAREVVVITGAHADATTAAARALGANAVYNPEFARGMFGSVQAGISALPEDCRAFFLLPVDIPLVREWTIQQLVRAFSQAGALAASPTFLGRRGHPPLLTAGLRGIILGAEDRGGLRSVLHGVETERPGAVIEVAVPDEGVLLDMDTEEDFRGLEFRASRLGVPTTVECRALWDEQNLPARTRDHCIAVAEAALCIGRALNIAHRPRQRLDLNILESAALVHDLAKGRRHHEAEGARLLRERGFDAVADIVAAHRDLGLADHEPITEREVVFMADKLVGGVACMPLERRYAQVLERHGQDPEAREAILGRLHRARRLLLRMEAETGRSLLELLAARGEGG